MRPEKAPDVTKAFYTVDDGKTWFADSDQRIVPFDHNGAVAVRVRVFTYDGGKTSFAGYLERFTPDVRKKLEAAHTQPDKPGSAPAFNVNSQEVLISGIEVKRPGDANWVKGNDLIGKSKITRISGPSGEPADRVYP